MLLGSQSIRVIFTFQIPFLNFLLQSFNVAGSYFSEMLEVLIAGRTKRQPCPSLLVLNSTNQKPQSFTFL